MNSLPDRAPWDPTAGLRSLPGPAHRRRRGRRPAALTTAGNDTAAISQAVARERARIGAWLHDGVLQTLELLAAGGYADEPDPQFMAAVAARAADEVRTALEGELPLMPGELVEQLHAIVQRERELAAHEIRLEVGALEPVPRGVHSSVLAAAAGEALRNARKHAAATLVTVSCEIVDGLATVTVGDDGAGFDPAAVHRGAGLRHSIVGRLQHEGGRAVLDTRLGAGTRVLLQLRLAPNRADARVGPPR